MNTSTQNQEGPGIYCTFWLEGYCFAVPSSTIREVHRAVPLTPVPGTSKTVRGYVNLRGQLYLVLSPDYLLFGYDSPEKKGRDLIVFRQSVGEAFAIEVDAIGDITPIRKDQYHTQISDQDAKGNEFSCGVSAPLGLVKGHATLSQKLVVLIDPSHFSTQGMAFENNDCT